MVIINEVGAETPSTNGSSSLAIVSHDAQAVQLPQFGQSTVAEVLHAGRKNLAEQIAALPKPDTSYQAPALRKTGTFGFLTSIENHRIINANNAVNRAKAAEAVQFYNTVGKLSEASKQENIEVTKAICGLYDAMGQKWVEVNLDKIRSDKEVALEDNRMRAENERMRDERQYEARMHETHERTARHAAGLQVRVLELQAGVETTRLKYEADRVKGEQMLKEKDKDIEKELKILDRKLCQERAMEEMKHAHTMERLRTAVQLGTGRNESAPTTPSTSANRDGPFNWAAVILHVSNCRTGQTRIKTYSILLDDRVAILSTVALQCIDSTNEAESDLFSGELELLADGARSMKAPTGMTIEDFRADVNRHLEMLKNTDALGDWTLVLLSAQLRAHNCYSLNIIVK